MDLNEKALQRMFDSLDDMESDRIFKGKGQTDKGITITIGIDPADNNGSTDMEGAGVHEPELPGDHSEEMNKGGMMGYNKGGLVNPEKEEKSDLDLPPFLRKKKKTSING